MKQKKTVLFLCVANSARSQIAEGLCRHFFKDTLIAESAGSHPSGLVQPFALKVLNELGAEHSFAHSKSIDELPRSVMDSLDFVITLCDEEICPQISGTFKKLHWPIKDPVQKIGGAEILDLSLFKQARDEIYKKLKEFALSLELK